MSLRTSILSFLVSAFLATAASASGGWCNLPGCSSCKTATPVMVEKTVLVPTYVTEKRIVHETKYRTENRIKTVTVQVCKPRLEERTRTYTVLVPEKRTKTVNYVVCKPVWETKTREFVVQIPVWNEVEEKYTVKVPVWKNVEQTYTVKVPVWTEQEREYTVLVPILEKRSATRTVTKCVPTSEKRTVRCDQGHWETQIVEVPCRSSCGGCGHCNRCCKPVSRTVCRRVWVPNVVEKEIDVTVYKRVTEEIPCEYTVRVCKPETRTETVKVCSYKDEQRTCVKKVCSYKDEVRTCKKRVCSYKPETRTETYKVCHYVNEKKSREVAYTVCVPEKRTEKYSVTVYDRVPEEREVTYKVCIPETVKREIDVRVCRMVAKTILVPACSCCR